MIRIHAPLHAYNRATFSGIGMYSAGSLRSDGLGGIREQYDNIIRETKFISKYMPLEERFDKAKTHIIDALKNRQPRPMSHSPSLTTAYHVFYSLQSWLVWEWLVFLLSYTYMYLVILDNESYGAKIGVEAAILAVFILDTFIDFYCRSFDKHKKRNKYPTFYFWKSALLLLMVIDLIVFAAVPGYGERPIRPFRIFRAFIPVMFDPQIRKSLLALASTYKQIMAFIIFYSVIICGFALVGSLALSFDPNFLDPSFPQTIDPYATNYHNLGRMIFMTYGLATYDYYPDNQILALQNHTPNIIFFVVFIFLNMFLFTSVPGGIIYSKFRDTRSKYIIVDEIKQQHSLILAFVTLAQDENNLPMDTLIKFLFFFYRSKVRYVEYITEICMKLDDNNNKTIQVNEFMEFSKILLYNSVMHPPTFDDIQLWVDFRAALNDHLRLKLIVKHIVFEVVVACVIVLGTVNSVFRLEQDHGLPFIFDAIFIWVYFVELLLRIIGIGPQNFFADRWNSIDCLMILLSVVFFFVKTGSQWDELVVLLRFFRIIKVFILLIDNPWVYRQNLPSVRRFKRLFSTFLEITPIIVRFFHLFAFFYFLFGVVGMEVFYSPSYEQVTDVSNYNDFIQFSNFNTFVHSQYVMMQILTEGGWSYIAWNYAWRNPHFYGLIVVLFMLMHLIIVSVVGMLLKGIFWEIYFTVSGMMDAAEETINSQLSKEEENEAKTQEINEIDQLIQNQESIEADTLLKREIIEKKLDSDILRRLKEFMFEGAEEGEQLQRSTRSINRSKIVERIMANWNISRHELRRSLKKKATSGPGRMKRRKTTMEFNSIEMKEEEDFQEQLQELINDLIISNQVGYSEIIAYPRVFVDFLNSKFQDPRRLGEGSNRFDSAEHPIASPESLGLHVYQVNNMLGNQSSKRETKNMIVNCLLDSGDIDEETADSIAKTRHVLQQFHVDKNGALRKMYLSETNQGLVKNCEIQYFSDVYGSSFRKINKITLQPLLRFESSLTYSLWNILRHSEIDYADFFHLLTHIQDQMSNKLLKMGSLVKFVYKIDNDGDIWFVVDYKRHQEMQIRFIKTGLWVYTPEMEPNRPYYARDVFKFDPNVFMGEIEREVCEQYIKKFYQNFETIGFSLIDRKSFFETNPAEYLYDLYVQTYPVFRKGRRSSSLGQLKISNMMLMVLSKEAERVDIGQEVISYPMSDIPRAPKQRKKEDFLFDDEDNSAYDKLKNLGAADDERIVESEGIPFAYILNLYKQISDMLQLYGENLVIQVEKALNDQYIKLTENTDSKSNNSRDDVQMPQVNVFFSESDLIE